MRHVSDQFGIANPNLVGIVLSHQLHKEFLQRMILGNHVSSSNRAPAASFRPCAFVIAAGKQIQVTFVSHLSASLLLN